MKKTHFLFVALLAWSSVWAQTAQDTVYIALSDQPDGGIYIPAPPAFTDAMFSPDFQMWQYGKTIRPTARGQQASDESPWLPDFLVQISASVLGIEINADATPAIYHFLKKAITTGDQSTKKAKEKYMRTRPFALMNEHTWAEYDDEEFLRTNGSYPSGHTALGWTMGLVTAELAPEYQDTILRRGFMFGENRWIVGAHWKSDVDAGYLCATASVARMHANPLYYADLAAAKEEYKNLTSNSDSNLTVKRSNSDSGLTSNSDSGLTSDLPYPDGTRIMEAMVDSLSPRYIGDIMGYWQGKELHDDSRIAQRAISGADGSINGLIRYFAPSVDIVISEQETPAIYQMLTYARNTLRDQAREIKNKSFRKRPYVQFDEPTLIPEDEEEEREESSYPSSHSVRGWGLALLLTELMPDLQDAILTTGYEYGYNRVVAGYHYLSDVQAGRLVAAYTVMRLHNDEAFMTLLENAKTEYAQKKASTDLQSVIAQSQQDSRGYYTLTGQYLGIHRPTQTGIYVHNGAKAFVR